MWRGCRCGYLRAPRGEEGKEELGSRISGIYFALAACVSTGHGPALHTQDPAFGFGAWGEFYV